MKRLAGLIIFAACIVGCGTSFTLSRPMGDGKGYITLDDSGGRIGWRGNIFGAKSTPTPAAKNVVPTEPDPATSGWMDKVTSWFK